MFAALQLPPEEVPAALAFGDLRDHRAIPRPQAALENQPADRLDLDYVHVGSSARATAPRSVSRRTTRQQERKKHRR